jgi:hypothetical protein
MKHAQRKAALPACNLIVVELHRVDGAAAKFVILRVWAENGTQQNSSLRALGMGLGLIYSKCRNHELILERSRPEFRDIVTNLPKMTKILQKRIRRARHLAQAVKSSF